MSLRRVNDWITADHLTRAEVLAFRMSKIIVKEAVVSLHDPEAKWKRKTHRSGKTEMDCPHTRWCPMGFYDNDPNLYYAKGWGSRVQMLPHERWLVWRIADRLYPPPVLGWTEADEAQERRLYEFNKLAFWLYPERWRGITDARTQPMNMEDHDMRSLAMIHQLAANRDNPKPATKPKPKFTPPAVVSAADFTNGGLDHVRQRG